MAKLHAKTRSIDSSLAFFLNQLEVFDPKYYEPLLSVTWQRDLKLRTDVSMGNESASFARLKFGSAGSLSQGADTSLSGFSLPVGSLENTEIMGVSVDRQKIVQPLNLMQQEISYSLTELDQSQYMGQSIDTMKINAFHQLYQSTIDKVAYIGDLGLACTGLVNTSGITSSLVAANGIGGSRLWINKTPDQIVADVTALQNSIWAASAFAVVPNRLLLPPPQYTYLVGQKVSSAGNVSVLEYLKKNNLFTAQYGRELDIQPLKWCNSQGAGASQRMVAYSDDIMHVRYPMVPLVRDPAYYRASRFFAPMRWKLGVIEFIYPATIAYADGI